MNAADGFKTMESDWSAESQSAADFARLYLPRYPQRVPHLHCGAVRETSRLRPNDNIMAWLSLSSSVCYHACKSNLTERD